ncbi:glucan endo-1,3-beta-glucosidase-like [Oppia nitens]|uniref:glucan endo-1,3-beta-glucosidase-like n=1 Tax=Oppia nitens TaxID=1686743 RepID=UPI0023DC270F|nr:glucan endo-1,3-beta-glucosidase-like [Oppia nitens]
MDDFNSDKLDLNNWEFQVGRGPNNDGWGNNELQYYTDGANIELNNGLMSINVKIDELNGSYYYYTSTRLLSKNSWTYGRFECRAKMPNGKNLWPGIWMIVTENNRYTNGTCDEIDIAMVKGERPNQLLANIHYYGGSGGGSQWPSKQLVQTTRSNDDWFNFTTDFSANFHIFGIEWIGSTIKWMVDGQQFFVENIATTADAPENDGQPPTVDHKFQLILDVAVGSGDGGSSRHFSANPLDDGPVVTTLDESRHWTQPNMLVDWCRVSQLNQPTDDYDDPPIILRDDTAAPDATTLAPVPATTAAAAAAGAPDPAAPDADTTDAPDAETTHAPDPAAPTSPVTPTKKPGPSKKPGTSKKPGPTKKPGPSKKPGPKKPGHTKKSTPKHYN